MINYVYPDCFGSPRFSTWQQTHKDILPKKTHEDIPLVNNAAVAFRSCKKATQNEISKLHEAVLSSETTGISVGINKNAIIEEYTQACSKKEGISRPVASFNKGEPTKKPTKYPTIPELVCNCQIKSSLNHQYQVEKLVLQIVIVILLRESDSFLLLIKIKNLSAVNHLYNEVTCDVCLLWN